MTTRILPRSQFQRTECPHCEQWSTVWLPDFATPPCPHFYCDRCSNVIHRTADLQDIYYDDAPSPGMVEHIAASLPGCPCGGRFEPGANPKCPHCGGEFSRGCSTVMRLLDPQMIVVEGAAVFGDDGEEVFRPAPQSRLSAVLSELGLRKPAAASRSLYS